MIEQQVYGELEQAAPFFAPADTDMVDALISQYQTERSRIEQVDRFLKGDGFGSVVHYFIEGNREALHGLRYAPSTERLFQLEPAIAALNANYWDRALKLTDVLDCMPQKRRDEWFEQIREHQAPEFEEESVRATLGDLLAGRSRFFAERVDGIFRALSREHVTNQPEGFGKRMILQRVIDQFGLIDHSTSGYINDLRCVIAKFMGRDEPGWSATRSVVDAAKRNPGQWLPVDGGALLIRVYLGVGTAHLEVHPDMAWRLNGILASLYPTAIPSRFREKPKRKLKAFSLFERPLPFAVVEAIASLEEVKRVRGERHNLCHERLKNTRWLRGDCEKAVRKEVERVLEAIGAVRSEEGWWQFDYDPQPVLDQVVCSGQIPDQKSHQFYPTPVVVADAAVELAAIGGDHRCLEPSAGVGNLAGRIFPCAEITCIEVSRLHCEVLKAKGYHAEQSDFLQWRSDRAFDRIVMNPPFSEGRWLAHVEHAASMLAPGGRLVAVLPLGAVDRVAVSGCEVSWHQRFKGEFAGTGIEVVLCLIQRRDG